MKHTIFYLIIVMLATISCSKDNMNNHEDYITTKLNICGDITEKYEPLMKSTTNDLIGIEVSEMDKRFDFADGLFDNPSNIIVNLKRSVKYHIKCIYIKDGKLTLDKNNNVFAEPFNASVRNEIKYQNMSTNSTYVSFNTYFNSKTCMQDMYYFEINDYIPSENGVLNVELKHTAFGLKYNVEGLTDGYISMVIRLNDLHNGSPIYSATNISSNGEKHIGVIRCYNIEDAFTYSDNYADIAFVSIKWMRGVNIEEDLGTAQVQLKRNMLNNIKINLVSKDKISGFGINSETENMQNENIDFEM